MKQKLAIATCAAYAELPPQEQLLLQKLIDAGIAAAPAVWSDPAVDWAGFDAVLIRTTWDYTRHYRAFKRWLQRVDRAGIRLFNAHDLLQWNMDKRYLLELAAAGIPVVPTHFIPQGSACDIDWPDWQTAKAVIKPAVSASARGTWVGNWPMPAEQRQRLIEQSEKQDLLLQPFMPCIQSQGEWSLMYFGGTFCHAVLKRAAKGEFRVQKEYGGKALAKTPPNALLALSRKTLAACPQMPHYARIDWVGGRNGWRLMELELVEPELFLDRDPAAAERLAAALFNLPGTPW